MKKHAQTETEHLRAAFDRLNAQMVAATDIMKGMPWVSATHALVLAGDRVSAEEAAIRVKNGSPVMRELYRVGSYARLDWAYQHLSRTELLSILPSLWRDSDPDDTDPRFLELWRLLHHLHRPLPVLDGDLADFDALPDMLTVYRGQAPDAVLGISWSLSTGTAKMFARTGGQRATIKNGVVLTAQVPKGSILAYLTKRQEQEVILDPMLLSGYAMDPVSA